MTRLTILLFSLLVLNNCSQQMLKSTAYDALQQHECKEHNKAVGSTEKNCYKDHQQEFKEYEKKRKEELESY